MKTLTKFLEQLDEGCKPKEKPEMPLFGVDQQEVLEKVAHSYVGYINKMKKLNPDFKVNVDTLFVEFASAFSKLLNEALKQELTTYLGYKKNERSKTPNFRNGFGKKTLKTRVGKLDIKTPRDRNGEFNSKIVPKRQGDGFDLEGNIIKLYAAGNSTQNISEIIEGMFGFEIDKSTISLVTSKLLVQADEFNKRKLKETYPFVFSDAIRIRVLVRHKVKDQFKYVGEDVTINIIMGIDLDGISDVLYFALVKNESAANGKKAYNNLKRRGVKKIMFVSCDNLSGVSRAIKAVFPNAKIQKCVVHMIRAANRYIPLKYRKAFSNDLKKIYKCGLVDDAGKALQELEKRWGDQYPKAIAVGKDNWDEITTFFEVPTLIRNLIYTSNRSESFNRTFRKITKTKGINRNKSAAYKLTYIAVTEYQRHHQTPIKEWDKISKGINNFLNPDSENNY